MPVDIHGRVKIVDQNSLVLPGKCALCGGHEGNFIDIGLDLDFYGVVYFCVENCFREIANAFDYHSPRQWKMVMAGYEDMKEKFNNLLDQNEELKNALDSLTKFNSLPSPPSLVEHLAMEISSESKPDKQGSDEQIDEQGSTDVQYDDSLDEFLKSI